jgi:Protein of unknown function (DUF1579)
MKRFTILCLLLVVGFVFAMQAQMSAPKPDPEVKKLNVYVGHWTYEGESRSGPFSPGGKFTGSATGQMILRGFFLEWRWKDQGPTVGTQQGLEIESYHAANKNYPSYTFVDDGSSCTGSWAINGNKFAYSGNCVDKGKQYRARVTEEFAPDLMSFVQKAESSFDGKTWNSSYEATYTKIKPASKK